VKELPPGWAWTTLGEACEITQGQSPPGSSYNALGQGLPFFQGKADFGEMHPTARSWCSAPQKLAAVEDILISIRAPVGPTNIAAEHCCIGRGLAALRARGDIHQRYVLHWLRLTEPELGHKASGSTFAAITGTQLAAHPLPLAPLDEQRRIVAEIEKQLSHLEAAITSTRDAGGRTASLRSAVLENVFSRPGYPLVPLGTLISSGPQNGIYKPSEAYGTGTPIIRIDDFQDQFLRDRSALRTLALDSDELSTYGLHIGDLVINRVNSMTHLGKCFVVPEGICPAVFESNMMRLSLIPSVTPRWVALYLQSPSGRGRLIQNAKQAVNQASINQRDVCSTPVPMPRSAQEQARQLERLEMHLDSVRAFRTACDLAQARATRLRQAILHKAFEGKLVPQDPNNEPASVLLDRIRATRAQTPARRAPRKREVHA